MITLPRPTREVVPRPTREVVPRQLARHWLNPSSTRPFASVLRAQRRFGPAASAIQPKEPYDRARARGIPRPARRGSHRSPERNPPAGARHADTSGLPDSPAVQFGLYHDQSARQRGIRGVVHLRDDQPAHLHRPGGPAPAHEPPDRPGGLQALGQPPGHHWADAALGGHYP